MPKTETIIKLFKIFQNGFMVVKFFIFLSGSWPTPTHEGLHHWLGIVIIEVDIIVTRKWSLNGDPFPNLIMYLKDTSQVKT